MIETPCTTVDYLTRCGVLLVGALFSYFANYYSSTWPGTGASTSTSSLLEYRIFSLITERQSPFLTLPLEFIFDSLPLNDTNSTSTAQVQCPNAGYEHHYWFLYLAISI